jgi:hypothetical protein
MNVTLRKTLVIATLSLLMTVVLVPSVLASSVPVRVAAPLGVNLNFTPNPVSQGSQTQIQISVSGGSPPYFLWFNASIPGCNPPHQPIQENTSSASFPCNPTSSGSFPAHLDVSDNLGDHGSAGATLTVQSSGGGGSGGSGSGTGNNTGGIDLSFLQNLLPVVMITGFVFLGSTVAIAVSAVALAILVPKRLKQLRKAIEAQSLRLPESAGPKSETPKDQPPGGQN